jgi:hypothetical protein
MLLSFLSVMSQNTHLSAETSSTFRSSSLSAGKCEISLLYVFSLLEQSNGTRKTITMGDKDIVPKCSVRWMAHPTPKQLQKVDHHPLHARQAGQLELCLIESRTISGVCLQKRTEKYAHKTRIFVERPIGIEEGPDSCHWVSKTSPLSSQYPDFPRRVDHLLRLSHWNEYCQFKISTIPLFLEGRLRVNAARPRYGGGYEVRFSATLHS